MHGVHEHCSRLGGCFRDTRAVWAVLPGGVPHNLRPDQRSLSSTDGLGWRSACGEWSRLIARFARCSTTYGVLRNQRLA